MPWGTVGSVGRIMAAAAEHGAEWFGQNPGHAPGIVPP